MNDNTNRFTKMHGLGNDFVVINAVNKPFTWSKTRIKSLANRSTGIGFDQLLVLEVSQDPRVDFFYRVFNADGSEVGQCGNGARCLARFIATHALSNKPQVRVQTQTSLLTLYLNPSKAGFSVAFPKVAFSPEKIGRLPLDKNPLSLAITPPQITQFYAAWIGNPHAICLSDNLEACSLVELGLAFNRSLFFPEGVNVSFLKQLNSKAMALRVFERGVGETMACGSAAIACAELGHAFLGMEPIIEVKLPGGSLHIDCGFSADQTLMTGPAETVFEGVLASCVS